MDDSRIVELYQERSESAIAETQVKYGRYCFYIAYNILADEWEAEECVNDTYSAAWNSIPPHKPSRLSTFLGKITRNLAINRYHKSKAKKRYNGTDLILDELAEVIGDTASSESAITDSLILRDAINSFLARQRADHRIVFVRRYWYMSSIDEISRDTGLTQSYVKLILHRLRCKLRDYLIERGVEI